MALKWIGKPLRRREDERLLRGKGQFIDDLVLPGMFHAALMVSPYAHARIKKVDVEEARRAPGVALVLAGSELPSLMEPITTPFDWFGHVSPLRSYPMAVDKVRFVGEPVAAVVADSRYAAEDAAELVRVEYEPLPPVVDVEKAVADDAPLLFESHGTNIVWHGCFRYGDVDKAFAQADRIVSDRLYYHRFSSTPSETFGAVAYYDETAGVMNIWSNIQTPGNKHATLAKMLKVPSNRLRQYVPADTGGGFGVKVPVFGQCALIGVLAKKLGRPVKYIEDRMEHLNASHHGSERVIYSDLAVKNDGTILGFKCRFYDNEGAYMHGPEPMGAILWCHIVQGCYDFRNTEMDCYTVVTNKSPVGPNRGYGRMQHQFMLERMIDKAAREIGKDPIEMRLQNLIQPDKFPYEATNGALYDSGDYPLCVRKALEHLDYDYWKREQSRPRSDGKRIGIGLISIMDPGGSNWAQNGLIDKRLSTSAVGEGAAVRIDLTGMVSVKAGTIPSGQSHESMMAQIVAEELGVNPEDVYVVAGFDSASHPYTMTSATNASRSAVLLGGAVVGAAQKLKEKMMAMVAHWWEVPVEILEFRDGKVINMEDPARSMTIPEVVRQAIVAPMRLPPGMDPSLEAIYNYNFPKATDMDENYRGNFGSSYANAVHATAIELDTNTGDYKILKYVVVSDCGTMINPMVVEGQVHGAVGHSLGAAKYEEFVYDDQGQHLSNTYTDYLCPKATEVPDIEVVHIETPSPFTVYGVKGMGEGSGPTPQLLAQAVENALGDLNIRISDSRVTPERIYRLIHQAKAKGILIEK